MTEPALTMWVHTDHWSANEVLGDIQAVRILGYQPRVILEGEAVREFIAWTRGHGTVPVDGPCAGWQTMCTVFGVPVFRLTSDVMGERVERHNAGVGCRR